MGRGRVGGVGVKSKKNCQNINFKILKPWEGGGPIFSNMSKLEVTLSHHPKITRVWHTFLVFYYVNFPFQTSVQVDQLSFGSFECLYTILAMGRKEQ